MNRKFVVVMGIVCSIFIVFGSVSAAPTTFEEEMLEVLKTNGVITQQDYDRLIMKIRVEHTSVNQEIIDLLREKNIISSDQYASLRQKARGEAGTVMVASAPPTPAPEAQAAVKQLQEESEKQKAEIEQAGDDAVQCIAKASNIELPSWVKKMKFAGDLRLRHDTQWIKDDNDDYDRNRERFRLRFGFTMNMAKNTEVGVRLASGPGFQNTTNQSFDEHSRGKDIFIDLVYATWRSCESFTLIGGKHSNPLFTTPLVWDPDVNPEGLSESLTVGLNENVQLFGNLGQWFIEEINNKSSDRDPTLVLGQLGTTIKPADKVKLQLALTYYNFYNLDDIEGDAEDLGDEQEFLGYNHRYGQQMILDQNGNLVNEFKCLQIGAKLSFSDVFCVPFSIFGDYIKNFDADLDDLMKKGAVVADGSGKVISDPAKLSAYGSDDRDTGWLIGCDFGNKKKKGDWYLQYHYQVLEDYAFPAVFVDSDFHGGGTNNQGHLVHGQYFLTDYIYAAATFFFTEREDESKDGKRDENRMQLDVVLKF